MNKYKYEKVKIGKDVSGEDFFIYESVSKAKKLEDEIMQVFVLAGLNGITVTPLKNLFKIKHFFRYNCIHELIFSRNPDVWFQLRIRVNSKNRVMGMWIYQQGGYTNLKDCFVVLDKIKNILIEGEENAIKD